jgi:hypothetical protein
MDGQYECLSPWAEVDPVPLRGISPRLADLRAKKIGFLTNKKLASRPIGLVAQNRLKERFPDLESTWFEIDYQRQQVDESLDKAKYEEDQVRFREWIKGCDAVISLVGD